VEDVPVKVLPEINIAAQAAMQVSPTNAVAKATRFVRREMDIFIP
jgi:hypothetical protein